MDDLKVFIKSSNKRLDGILKKLNLSREDLKPAAEITECVESLNPKEPDFPMTFTFGKNTVKLAPDDFRKIVCKPQCNPPEKFSDLQLNFSREEKLRIYEHVIEETKHYAPDKTLNTPLMSPADEAALADIVAANKREQKRKKRKFRTSKPTHTEQIRNLVGLQMQALHEYLDSKANQEARSMNRTDRKRSRSPAQPVYTGQKEEAKRSRYQPSDIKRDLNSYHEFRHREFQTQSSRRNNDKTERSPSRPRSPKRSEHQRRKCRSPHRSRSPRRSRNRYKSSEDTEKHYRNRSKKNHKKHHKHKHKKTKKSRRTRSRSK